MSENLKGKIKYTDFGVDLFIEVPGYKKPEIAIEVTSYGELRVLCVTAANERYGRATISVPMRDVFSFEDSVAELEDGILNIFIPVRREYKPVLIQIK